MELISNPFRGRGLPQQPGLAEGRVARDPSQALALFGRCPAAAKSPLLVMPELAEEFGVAALYLKDERQRMGLGSFKALGATHALGIHWGTFQLTDEAREEPVTRLAAALAERGIDPARFIAATPGETYSFPCRAA